MTKMALLIVTAAATAFWWWAIVNFPRVAMFAQQNKKLRPAEWSSIVSWRGSIPNTTF